MTITLENLVTALRSYAPLGVELPRDHDTNQIDMAMIQLWAEDAAGALNKVRAKTTIKQTNITTTADVQDYSLPDDCREVIKIERSFNAPASSSEVLDVPVAQGPFLGYGVFGCLPSGQEISGSLDLLNRQRLVRTRREDQWEMFSGQIRFDFPTSNNEIIRVTYRGIDRSLASLPDDYFTAVLTYLRWQNLEWYISKNGVQVVVDADRLQGDRLATMMRQARALEQSWISILNGISPEA